MTSVSRDFGVPSHFSTLADFESEQDHGLQESRRELDEKISEFNTRMKTPLAMANLLEAVGRSGGCGSLDTQQAAVIQTTISSRQNLSEALLDVSRRVEELNQLEAEGTLTRADVDEVESFVEALSRRVNVLEGTTVNGSLTLRGLLQQPIMNGSASNPQIANPSLKAAAGCSGFSGIPFSAVPDLPRLTGVPGSAGWTPLGNQFTRLKEIVERAHNSLETPAEGQLKSPVQLLRDNLAEFNELVIRDTGRDYLAALDQVDWRIHEAALRRNALAKQYLDSGSDDLTLLDKTVSASRELAELYLVAKLGLMEAATMAVERTKVPRSEELVPVPAAVWIYRAGVNHPLLSLSNVLEKVIFYPELQETSANFKLVPRWLAEEKGLCKTNVRVVGYVEVPRGFEKRPLPSDPLSPRGLTCRTSY